MSGEGLERALCYSGFDDHNDNDDDGDDEDEYDDVL